MSIKRIEAHLQAAAKAAHRITIKEELKKWTLHSIRVDACVLLREGGHDGPFINVGLRWKSDTFILYLRNTADMAAQHLATISQSKSLGWLHPFFLYASL